MFFYNELSLSDPKYWIGAMATRTTTAMTVDSSGNIYFAATDSNSQNKFLLGKTDYKGTLQWQKEITSDASFTAFIPRSLIIDSSSNIYVVGYSNTANLRKSLAIKLDSSATILWKKLLRFRGQPTNDSAGNQIQLYNASLDGSENLVVCGQVVQYMGAPSAGYAAILSSANGSFSQDRVYAVTQSGNIKSGSTVRYFGLSKLGAGSNHLLCGYYTDNGPKGILISNTALGGMTTTKFITFSGATTYSSNGVVRQLSNPNCVIASIVDSKIHVISYNSSLNSINWKKRLDVNASITDVRVDSQQNIYILAGVGGAQGSTLILKYDSSGTLLFQRTLNVPTTADMQIDNNGNMYISTSGKIAKLPSDGTLTGTYGAYVYAESSYTESTAAVATVNSLTLTEFTNLTNNSDSNSTITDGTDTLDETVIQYG